jgi:hypothetical protein
MNAQPCGLCAAIEPLRALRAAPKAAGSLRIDREALRRELGGRPEIVDAAPAKASGRPSANAAVMWRYFTTSVYQSGDLPVLATREAAQNARDAIASAARRRQIRAGEGRFEVTWDAASRSLSWDDNGVGMDTETILGKFLVIGESGKRDAGDSEEAAGGFGVAKAVILGASSTFRWELHSRDNLAVGRGAASDVDVFDHPPRQGTRITIHDVSEDFDSAWEPARSAWVPLEDRLRELLAANDLPGLTLVFNGHEVRPMFSRRGGSKVAVEGWWGSGTEASVKAYRRPPGDKGGAYYIRLNGLFQFRVSARRSGLKVDVVIDLATTVRPGQSGYPLNAARDALQDRARWAFDELAEEVERENESTGRSDEEEVYDPDSDDPRERAGADELAALQDEAFRDPAFQRALSEAAGGIMGFYAERLKYAEKQDSVSSLAPRGTRPDRRGGDDDGDGEERGPVLPPGFKAAEAAAPIEADIAAPSQVAAGAAGAIRAFLQGADEAVLVGNPNGEDPSSVGRRDRGIFGPAVEQALDQVARGEADDAAVATVEQAIERAADTAMGPGGGGLLQVAAVPRVLAALDRATGQAKARNPFGRHAGLRISKKTYDRARAARFKRSYARWLPFLVAWDAALRLIAGEARIRRRFKPGFVLDDTVLGLTARTERGSSVIYIHPDRFAQAVKAHRERPLAIAAYLHGIACHELTHLDSGRLHARGHDERYVAAREDLGAATGHLLPAIAILVQKVLQLPEPENADHKRIDRLGRDLDRARTTIKEQRAKIAQLQRSLDRVPGDEGDLNGHQTPNTRLRWSDLRGWLDAWRQIQARRISATRHRQEAVHLDALPDAVIEAAGAADRDEFEQLLFATRPPPGLRADHPSVRLLNAIDRARGGAGRVKKGLDAGRLLGVAIATLRARPPGDLDPAYIDGFVARNRPSLLTLIHGAFGGAP